MKLPCRVVLCLIAMAGMARGEEDLPRRSGTDSLDFEPKLMLDGPRAQLAPEVTGTSPAQSIADLQAALIRAKARAGDAEKLYKEGILAKVEAEQRATRVVRVAKELADAVLADATEHAGAVRKSLDSHQAAQADLDAAMSALASARDAASAASAAWTHAQLDAATLDLQRKRKLYREGVGSRHEVEIAEDRVALLTGSAPAQ